MEWTGAIPSPLCMILFDVDIAHDMIIVQIFALKHSKNLPTEIALKKYKG